jgi:hypothetical protein
MALLPLLLTLALSRPAAAAEPPSTGTGSEGESTGILKPEQELDAAIADYLDGNLEAARLALIHLAGDPRLAQDTELQQQAQVYLGVVLYFMGERDASWETFVSVSLNDPEYVMDPFVHPPDVETFFKSAREYALDFGRSPPRVIPAPPGDDPLPLILSLVPGRLQLYNDQPRLAYLTIAGVSLTGVGAVGIGLYMRAQDEQSETWGVNVVNAEERARLALLRDIKNTSTGVSAGLWGLGVIQGALKANANEPEAVTFSLAPVPGGGVAVVRLQR